MLVGKPLKEEMCLIRLVCVQLSFPSLLPSSSLSMPASALAVPLCSHLNRKAGSSFTLIINVGYPAATNHSVNYCILYHFSLIPCVRQGTTKTYKYTGIQQHKIISIAKEQDVY